MTNRRLKASSNLYSIDHHAFDRRFEDHLRGDGVEGHLVIRRELTEVVVTGRDGRGLVVSAEYLAGVAHDLVEVAAEEVGLLWAGNVLDVNSVHSIPRVACSWSPIQLKAKAQLHRRGAILQDERF